MLYIIMIIYQLVLYIALKMKKIKIDIICYQILRSFRFSKIKILFYFFFLFLFLFIDLSALKTSTINYFHFSHPE